jgi:hypothetical protein
MAIPLNEFKTRTAKLVSKPPGGFIGDSDVIYTTPNGITAIVLMAQAANTSEDTVHNVTFQHFDVNSSVATSLVRNFEVQPNDAAGLITGKLIVEQNNKIRAFTEDQADSDVQLVFSFLQALNG